MNKQLTAGKLHFLVKYTYTTYTLQHQPSSTNTNPSTMTARHHSLPPASLRRPSSSHSLTSSTTAAAAPTTLLARHATAHGAGTNASRLVAQADALARMTLELNLRAVSSQANRMEKQLRKLVLATADDAEFRRQNEARMSAMWREIVAVRQRAGEQKDIAFLDAETCRRETEKVVRGIRDEVGELKELVAGISTLVDGLPSAEEVKRLVGEEKKTVVEQQVCSPAKTQPLKSRMFLLLFPTAIQPCN